MLAAAAEQLAGTLRSLPIVAARTKAVSSTTLQPLDSREAVLESLVRQMTETVRWIDVVEQLYAEGVRTFVEVGPSGVLTGLTRRILEGRSDATFLQFDQRGRSPRQHLERLRDQLAAVGGLRSSEAVPAAVTSPRAAGQMVSFDATARRRQRNRSAAAGQERAGSRRPVGGAQGHGNGSGNGDGHGNEDERAVGGVHGRGDGSSGLPAPWPSDAAAVEQQPATATVNRLAAAPSVPIGPEPDFDRTLEDLVEELLLEHGLTLPLGAAAEARAGGRRFLDALEHLFAVTAAERQAVLRARSLSALCDVLARTGGKADWLPRRAAVDDAHVARLRGPANGHQSSNQEDGRRQPAALAASSSHAGAARGAEVESFLIEFVVEQTGYPAEIVELDADLEADLGIDSIRKAQLFGEVGQRYGLDAEDGVSLDDFPTLRHLIDYLVPRLGGPPAAASAPGGHGRADRNGGDQAGIDVPRASVAVEPAPTVPSPLVTAAGLAAEVESFLIEFVVEQTGYPAEIVELDADLEADLGIDSIRKAQLFGEVGQ
ncbi:MAG: hypothetical protein FJ275_12850, partial [Planctomycetes bacterium]|nr:hypothetical protein [Planctomycetota bacterium]